MFKFVQQSTAIHFQPSKMWLFKLCLLVGSASAARILGVVLTPAYSHQAVFKPLWRELSLRGHQVTTITTHPLKDPKLTNLTEIDLSVFTKSPDKGLKQMMEDSRLNIFEKTRRMFALIVDMVDMQLAHPAVRELLDDKNAKFDLVIMEHLWDSVLPFAVRFNCPFIGMLSIDAPSGILRYVGNPVHSSLYPDALLPYGNKLSLFERVTSFVVDIGLTLYNEHVLGKLQRKVIDKHFGSHYPPIGEMAQNISMLFVNADPIWFRL
ncbi:hypothetical protein PPYR_03258 [Photinus pyralis]|uniref:Uncharacterized protein n=1 Tax=Photinus pyralis TaxID=7054 RepID=A0A5N4A2F2_PHOPY|nr:hypothetical protein PPYR_03258 [Photinus pyralis]